MGQVAALRQIHAHDGVAGPRQRQEHGRVGLGAGMRLDVGVIAVEQRLDPLQRQAFGHVHVLATAVVAAARITSAYLLVNTESCTAITSGLA